MNVIPSFKNTKKNSSISSIKTKKQLLKLNSSKDNFELLLNYIEKLRFTNKLNNYKGYRIFLIGVHGVGVSKNIIDTGKERLNYNKILTPYKRNEKNLNIINTQPFGRNALVSLEKIFINDLSKKYMKLLTSGLVNMKNKKEIEIMNFYTTQLYYNLDNGLKKYSDLRKKLIKKGYPKYNDNSNSKLESITEYMKYNYKNPCENYELAISESTVSEFNGVFEMKDNTLLKKLETLQFFRNKVDLKHPKSFDVKNQLCLDHKFSKDIDENDFYPGLFKYDSLPLSFKNVLKYNQEFIKRFGEKKEYYFKLNDLIDIIYSIGDIKKNEKVCIILNNCRGINREITNSKKIALNTLYDLSDESKKKGLKRRRFSKTNMLKSIYE